ncbi:GTPase [Lentisalinibacter orientalis]|uniref:GTPase n=1 Tax=Lentisalinibacter orientalis TaxID=2992241 RepID=UPI00386F0E32
MKVDRILRTVLILAVILLFVAVIAGMLFITESALNVWDRLREAPAWLVFGYAGVLLAIALAAVWIVWRFLLPRRSRREEEKQPVFSEEALKDRLTAAEAAGIDVVAARGELAALDERRATGRIHLALFGEISTGKSSLLRALVPGAEVDTSPVGGSTREIARYQWHSPNGEEVVLTDVPGTGAVGGEFDAVAREEALRAHVVLYLCDGDLSRQEAGALGQLVGVGKPTILVLNKTDQYTEEELHQVMERLQARLQDLSPEAPAVAVRVSARADEAVMEEDPDGELVERRRTREPDIAELVLALNEQLARGRDDMDRRRDAAVFALATEKLQAAETAYRARRAEEIIRSYTRKAVIGALAAVSPGTDIVIQGYLGTAMTRALSALYGISPRDLDIEQFLNLSQSRVGRALPLTLAVAGNGLKAFPGVGTVAGGLVHAVAYGLIFDALGRSLVQALAARGRFSPEAAAEQFEENLSEYLETGVRRVAQIALREQARRRDE